MSAILFKSIDWDKISKTVHEGEEGKSFWKTIEFDNLRVRIVEYLPGYIANHWCQKGHIVHCLEGEFVSELDNGESFILTKGMTYIVSDNQSSHRSKSIKGVKLLIIDGTFLK
jgi:quercetin dioxygenase-like cupin family protein